MGLLQMLLRDPSRRAVIRSERLHRLLAVRLFDFETAHGDHPFIVDPQNSPETKCLPFDDTQDDINGVTDCGQNWKRKGASSGKPEFCLSDVKSILAIRYALASLMPGQVSNVSSSSGLSTNGSSGFERKSAHFSTVSSAALNGVPVIKRNAERMRRGSPTRYRPAEGRERAGRPPQLGRGQVLVDHVCRILNRADSLTSLSQMGIKLDPFHVSEILKRQTDVTLAREFFQWATSQTDYQHNSFTYNVMIRLLTLAKDFDAAQGLMEEMYVAGCSPDVVTYTILVKGFSAANRYQDALDAFQHMQAVGCKPNHVTYVVVMNIFARTGAVDEAWELFNRMRKEGLQPSVMSYSLMINCLGRAGNLSAAIALFGDLKASGCKPDVFIYTNMIDAHAKAGLFEQAFELYREMLRAGIKPDLVTLCAVMDCLGKAGDVVGASRLFDYLKARGYRPDSVAYTTIIDIHSKAGFFQKAVELFNEMKAVGVQTNTVNYNSMIDCYGRAGNLPAAVDLFREMKASRRAPDVQTYGILICHHAKLGLLESCLQLFEEVQRAGLQPNSVILIAMVDCFGKVGNFTAALDLFLQMQEMGYPLDVICYSRMIDICGKCGHYDKAMDFYHEMQEAGLEPNVFTYNALIHCLGKSGNPTAAQEIFTEMQQRGCEPNIVTYNTLIDMYSKAGNPDLSLESYRNLLSAGLQPDSGTFITLMEVLGKAGLYEDAENMFTKMKECGHDVRLPAYNILIDMWGKVGNIEKVTYWHKMLSDSGVVPDIVTIRNLISTYLRVHMYDEVLLLFRDMASLVIPIDCSLTAILLQHCSDCEHQEQVDALLSVLAKVKHPSYAFVNKLLGGELEDISAECKRFFDSLQGEETESKVMFNDALIMFLHNLNRNVEAGHLWDYALENNYYPQAVTMRQSPNLWFMDFHSMSVGTSLVALTRTLASFRDTMLKTNVVPDQVFIITGWGKGSKVPGCSTVKQAVQEKLGALKSPFWVNSLNPGCFVCKGEPFSQWVRNLSLD
ncbi:protein MpPPR_71 [Marchantia polymorpha subsp. ruderalis]|uniref:Smr domain-containing protein n=2 Tax=Marchantia polymorpha TaxID=3197 RepID=A0AAF6B3A8_MARPO|nr:hypothetical protein MARPO_0089s0054 [Marchantia polymorpha]BBN06492.1 hypothetical protein Mp_3g21620 [Marchantia polymorpha subsp. ruderalis]|eukprot:PTQ33427.1 hypothetical protein MARPO_0089s0054 [Marchantia polymorpha]